MTARAIQPIRPSAKTAPDVQRLPEQILDHLVRPVLVIDSQRDLHFGNAAARRLLARSDIAWLRNGKLCFADRNVQSRLDACVSRVTKTIRAAKSPGAIVVRARYAASNTESSSQNYRILVTPLAEESGDSRWLLFISESLAERTVCLDVLKQLHGLTHTESLLVSRLFSGDTLNTTATALGISINTAKTHLRQVFQKCDVQSQAELLQLVALGPRAF